MYCLAFAEEHHGSDLAAIETRGDVLGNEVSVTGVKTWVAGADRAEGALVLCRTAPAELSCVVVPLPNDAVDLRPIQDLSGENLLFELRLDAALAPLSSLRADGLQVAMRELERLQYDELEREFWDLVETARQYGRNRDPHIRQQLAWAYAQVRVIRSLAEREPLLAKVMWSEYHRRFGEIAIDVMGNDGLVRQEVEGYVGNRWQHVFLASRADTIAHRTSEMQRDLIAEQRLGLPE